MSDLISRQEALKPYEKLNDNDVISVWLIRKNLEEQEAVNKGKSCSTCEYSDDEFSGECYECVKDYDSLKFLTDEEKQIIIESALKDIRLEIVGRIKDLIDAHDWGNIYGMAIVCDMIDEKIKRK